MKKVGDRVEKVLKPIAKKLGMEDCATCKEVKDLLNDGKFMEAIKKRLGLK